MPFDFSSPGPLATGHLRFVRLWLAVGFAMVACTVVASLVSIPTTSSIMLHDKALHLCAYAGLTAWFTQVFRHDLTRLLVLLGFCALGVGVEYLQALTPTRQFDVLDMVANSSGAVLAWALSYTRVGEVLPTLERWFAGATVAR